MPSYAKREHSEETSGAGRETGGLLAGARRLGDLAGLADWVRWRTGMPREEAIWDKLVGARGQGVGVSRRPESTGRRWLAGRLTRVWCDLARLICPGVCGGLEICAGTPAVPSTYRTSVNRQISGGNFMEAYRRKLNAPQGRTANTSLAPTKRQRDEDYPTS